MSEQLDNSHNIARFNKMYSPESALGEKTLYLNLGYWTDSETTFDAGFERLIREVAELAKISEQDSVLDVGCGLGDQDFFIARHYRPKQIKAINISQAQLHICKNRQPGDLKNLTFQLCDAHKLPFADATFDVVLAIESAHHFADKIKFFAEAHRTLKPGGRLVMADLLGQDESYTLVDYAKLFFILPIFSLLYKAPAKNFLAGPNIERQQLSDAGFTIETLYSVYELVVMNFIVKFKDHVGSKNFRKKSGLWFYLWARLAGLAITVLGIKNLPVDYVLLSAKKTI